MAFKKIRNNGYICDTREDLKLIKEKDLGAECYVIKEAAEYKLMSTGEWVKQTVSSGGGADIDTSEFVTHEELNSAINEIEIPSLEGYATEEFVTKKISEIEIPIFEPLTPEEVMSAINAAPVLKMFAEDPEIMEQNPGSQFGIALNKGDERTLPEVMLSKGVGMYNFWIHKSNPSLPAEAIEKNSSCRGLCCVDTVKDTGWYGWILLFDQDGEVYSQYIRNSEPKGWKRFMTV